MHLNISFLPFLFKLNRTISVVSSLKKKPVHEFSKDEEQHVIIYEGWLSKLEAELFLKIESQETGMCAFFSFFSIQIFTTNITWMCLTCTLVTLF